MQLMHPKYQSLRKFILLLSVLLGYFAYLSWKFDLETGGIVSVLTWSFFVLCTPIADAGFLLDFPVRLITGIRMFLTEILVWVIAIGQNVLCLHLAPQHYQITYLTRLLYQVLTTPWPYWTIIVLSGLGTFLSIQLGDELMDAFKQRRLWAVAKQSGHVFLIKLVLFVAVFAIYVLLLRQLHVTLPN